MVIPKGGIPRVAAQRRNPVTPAKSTSAHNYLFVFAEPRKVSNVPFFELQSLLRQHGDIKVMQEADFFEGMSYVFDGYVNSSQDPVANFPYINRGSAYLYPLEQSCIVSSDVEIDLFPVVANSGYIHSAGKLVLAGRWDTMHLQDIKKVLEVEGRETSSMGLEFWTSTQPPDPGLEGLAIDEKRYFISNLPFSSQASLLGQICAGRGDASKVTIFKDIHHDKGDTRYPESGDSVYMLAFTSQVRKFNPLHMLDEYKPYWKGIDTTPQALMAAMLNIACLRQGGRFLDIFGGMGTSMIEATKVRPAQAVHNDIMEIQGAKDNYDLLTRSPEEIRDLIRKLASLKTTSRKHFETLSEIARNSLDWADVGKERSYPRVLHVEDLEQRHPELKDFANRIYFYMLRRGYYSEAHLSGREGLLGNVDKNLGLLNSYAVQLERALRQESWNDNGVTFVASFPKRGPWWETRRMDMTHPLEDGESLPFNSLDGIVTDAPYGYGTDSDNRKLVQIYQNFIAASFDLLKPFGQLIFCVLDKVRTGKAVSTSLTTQGVTEMVQQIAAAKGTRFSYDGLEEPAHLMYWKSQKKLNRGIVRITVAK
ncbi:MAG: hypothetical protein ABIA67_00110 [Candidatus Margulisiibacteriota bacterium]